VQISELKSEQRVELARLRREQSAELEAVAEGCELETVERMHEAKRLWTLRLLGGMLLHKGDARVLVSRAFLQMRARWTARMMAKGWKRIQRAASNTLETLKQEKFRHGARIVNYVTEGVTLLPTL